MPGDERDVRRQVAAVEAALDALDRLAPPARAAALHAVQSLAELYGEGLARVVACAGPARATELAGDELLAHLFILHDLHPVPLAVRVERALDEVRPYLRSHGGGVELLGLEGATLRVRLAGSCHGCPSSALTLRRAVEDAVTRAAPEIERIEADGAVAPVAPVAPRAAAARWTVVEDLDGLAAGSALLRDVAGEPVLFVDVGGIRYAYRPGCPTCGGTLAAGSLDGASLRCVCGAAYDVRQAGRALGGAPRALEPVPLLPAGAGVRVALGAEAA